MLLSYMQIWRVLYIPTNGIASPQLSQYSQSHFLTVANFFIFFHFTAMLLPNWNSLGASLFLIVFQGAAYIWPLLVMKLEWTTTTKKSKSLGGLTCDFSPMNSEKINTFKVLFCLGVSKAFNSSPRFYFWLQFPVLHGFYLICFQSTFSYSKLEENIIYFPYLSALK